MLPVEINRESLTNFNEGIHLPNDEYTPDIVYIRNISDTMKRIGGEVSKEMFLCPVDIINVKPEFIIRVRTQKYEEHIQKICDSILQNGFHYHEPLGVFFSKEDGVEKIFVHSGHSRLEAVKLAIEKGATISTLPCVPVPRGTSQTDIQLSLLTSNTASSLTPFEKSIVIHRLSKDRLSVSEIAKKTNLPDNKVSEYLLFSTAPEIIKSLVAQEVVSIQFVVSLAKEFGMKKAVRKILLAKKKAESAGRKRVQPRDDQSSRIKKDTIKLAPKMLDVFVKLRSEEVFDLFPEDIKSAINEFMSVFANADENDDDLDQDTEVDDEMGINSYLSDEKGTQ